jgi:hypothetical protein
MVMHKGQPASGGDAWLQATARDLGRYFHTVRGETRKPSLSNSSLAMRSLPHVGFSRAMRRMSARRSAGIGGRPD